MRAMILAAGRGERMGALAAARPKPLLEVGGRMLIERHLEALARAGIREVVVNVARGGALIERALGDGGRFRLSIRYSDEGEQPLETAGGIVRALPWLGDGPFLVLAADVVTDFDLAKLVHAAAPTLVLVDNPPHHPEGDFGLDAEGRLTLRPPRYTYAGIALLERALFAHLPPGQRPLRPVFETAIATRALRGLRHGGLWIDVGTPERLAEAERRLGRASRATEQA